MNIVAMTALVLLGTTPLATRLKPTSAQLAAALHEPGTADIAPARLRVLRCRVYEGDGEFFCEWRQRIAGAWRRRSGDFAFDGKAWHSLDRGVCPARDCA